MDDLAGAISKINDYIWPLVVWALYVINRRLEALEVAQALNTYNLKLLLTAHHLESNTSDDDVRL